MFKEIMVAFDGSDHSEAALQTACDLAAKYQANLQVVHAPQLYKPTIGVSGTAVSVLAQQDALQQTGDVILKRAEKLAKRSRSKPQLYQTTDWPHCASHSRGG